VRSVWGMIKRVKDLEGWKGLNKGECRFLELGRRNWDGVKREGGRDGADAVEKCVTETSRVESFLAPSLFSIVLVVSP